jgi:uncharacterized protein
MPAVDRKLLVSLHDVTPRHAPAIRQILTWLEKRGLPPAQLLVVPDFHGEWPLSAYPDFCQELRTLGESGHELVLHGYYHREDRRVQQNAPGFGERFQRKFMTAGEGEFLALSSLEAGELLDKGLYMWNQAELGAMPQGFIPPAWLHRADLDEALWKRGFQWTENHSGFRFRDGTCLEAPVVTWASRDAVRRIGSRVFCPAAVMLQKRAPLLRLAIHPHDFDHPALIRSIDRTLKLAGKGRTAINRTDSAKAIR